MAKKNSKKNRNTDVKAAQANDTSVISKPEAVPAAEVKEALTASKPTSVRSEAARRTTEGKFTRQVFAKIGGTECPRFAPMTWKERDAFMAKDTPESQAVKARYDEHMTSAT